MVRIYTKTGTTAPRAAALRRTGRQGFPTMQVNGAVDEAQAMMGVARAEAVPGFRARRPARPLGTGPLRPHGRGATDISNRCTGHHAGRRRDRDGVEVHVDERHRSVRVSTDRVRRPRGKPRLGGAWTCPAQSSGGPSDWSCLCPIRCAVTVGRYLNRLSDPLWAMARWTEGEDHLLARGAKPGVAVAPVLGRHRAGRPIQARRTVSTGRMARRRTSMPK